VSLCKIASTNIKEELHGEELGVVAVLGVGLADLTVSWS
jgi:hypothetical protein